MDPQRCRIGFTVDPDPAFYLNVDPVPGSQINADPGGGGGFLDSG
jgi:hypothetical protein